tara:strand:+ start:727 stop:1266 length:540 start_codon:yes stop_codon:yes gene_type:complete
MKLTEQKIKDIIREETLKYLKEIELAKQVRSWKRLPAQLFRNVIKSIEYDASEEAQKDREFADVMADINKLLITGVREFLRAWTYAGTEKESPFLDEEGKNIFLQGLYPNTPRNKADDLVVDLVMHKPNVLRDDMKNTLQAITKKERIAYGMETPEYISPEFIEEIIKEEVIKYFKENE